VSNDLELIENVVIQARVSVRERTAPLKLIFSYCDSTTGATLKHSDTIVCFSPFNELPTVENSISHKVAPKVFLYGNEKHQLGKPFPDVIGMRKEKFPQFLFISLMSKVGCSATVYADFPREKEQLENEQKTLQKRSAKDQQPVVYKSQV